MRDALRRAKARYEPGGFLILDGMTASLSAVPVAQLELELVQQARVVQVAALAKRRTPFVGVRDGVDVELSLRHLRNPAPKGAGDEPC